MKNSIRVAVGAFVFAALLVILGGTASATHLWSEHPVFVQNDNLAGNQIVAYDRAGNGVLSQAGIYYTGGDGGALEGSELDHLASQGSLAYDARHRILLAVNAGSDTVSVLGVAGDRLALRQVIASDGSFPASIAIHGNIVFVLNAEGWDRFRALRSSRVGCVRSQARTGTWGSAQPKPSGSTHTPGQVAFSPDGGSS